MTPVSTAQILQSQPNNRASLAAFWQKSRGGDVALRKDRSTFEPGESEFARELSERKRPESNEIDDVENGAAEDLSEAEERSELRSEVAQSTDSDAPTASTADPSQNAGERAGAAASPTQDVLVQAVYEAALETIDPVLAGSSVRVQSQLAMRTAGALKQDQAQAGSLPQAQTNSPRSVTTLADSWQQGSTEPSTVTMASTESTSQTIDQLQHVPVSTTHNLHAKSHASDRQSEAISPDRFVQAGTFAASDPAFEGSASAALLAQAAELASRADGRSSPSRTDDRSTAVDRESRVSQADLLRYTPIPSASSSGSDHHHSSHDGRQSHPRGAQPDASGNQGAPANHASAAAFGLHASPSWAGVSSSYTAYQPANALQTERAIFAAMQAGSQESGASQEVVLRLFPAKLGSMKLRVTLDQQPHSKPSVRVELKVESQQAQDAMSPTLAGLQSALSKQGFADSKIELSVDSESVAAGSNPNWSSPHIDHLGLDDVA